MNTEDILPIEIWYRSFIYLNNSHDLINLLSILKFTRNYVLSRFDKKKKLSSGFCALDFWGKKLRNNRVNLLSKLYTELDVCCDFDIW